MSRTPWPVNPTRPIHPGRRRFTGPPGPLTLSQRYPQELDESGRPRVPSMPRAPAPQPFYLPPNPQQQSSSGSSVSTVRHIGPPPAPPGQPPHQPPAPPGEPPSQPPAPPGQPPSQPPAPPGQPPHQPPAPPGQPPSIPNRSGPFNNGAGGEYSQAMYNPGDPLSANPGFPVSSYIDWVRSEMMQGRLPAGPPGETPQQEKERYGMMGLGGYYERLFLSFEENMRRHRDNNNKADERADRTNAWNRKTAEMTNAWNRNTAEMTNTWNRDTAMKAADRTVQGNRKTAYGVAFVGAAAALSARTIPTPAPSGTGTGNAASAQAYPGGVAANSGQYVGNPSQNTRRFHPNGIPGQGGNDGVPQMPDWVKPDGAVQDPHGTNALDGQPYYAEKGYNLPAPTVPDPGIHDGLQPTKTTDPGMAPRNTRRFQPLPQ